MSAHVHSDSSPAFSGFFTFASQGVESQYFYNDLLNLNVSGYQEDISIGEISTVSDILSSLHGCHSACKNNENQGRENYLFTCS